MYSSNIYGNKWAVNILAPKEAKCIKIGLETFWRGKEKTKHLSVLTAASMATRRKIHSFKSEKLEEVG